MAYRTPFRIRPATLTLRSALAAVLALTLSACGAAGGASTDADDLADTTLDSDPSSTPESDGAPDAEATVSKAQNPSSAFNSISAGPSYACGVTTSGGVSCWGANGFDVLGDGSGVNSRARPGPVPGVSGAASVATGTFAACAVKTNRTAQCWGSLGDAQGKPKAFPLTNLKALLPSELAVCALLQDGTVRCTTSGQVLTEFVTVTVFPGRVKSLDGGPGSHYCALVDGGGNDRVSCFGTNNNINGEGQLGNQGSPNRFAAQEVPEVRGAKQVTVGAAHSCALVGSDVFCWGSNGALQLGNFDASSATPQKVAGLGKVKAIDAGAAHTCALLDNGNVRCWGDVYGAEPFQVDGVSKAASVSAGSDFACIVDSNHAGFCFGNNDFGQLGNPVPADTNGETDLFPGTRVL